jgi:hypothetical protein
MEKMVPQVTRNAHSPERAAQGQARQSQSGVQTGRLSQLATLANGSSQMQAQLKLAGDLQSSSQVKAQHSLAEQMNAASPVAAQLKKLKEKPAQAKSKLEEKKPKQLKSDGVAQGKREEKKRPAQKKAKDKEKPRQAMFAGRGAPAQLEEAPAINRTGLPDQLKAGVEGLSGLALDDVKVHYNSAKPAQLNALAYAQGTDIHVAPGQEKHLPHEAWHVVQQHQGRVQPTTQTKGVAINDEAGLEHEADVMGAKAVAAQRRQDPDSRRS